MYSCGHPCDPAFNLQGFPKHSRVALKFLAAHWLGEEDIKARFQVTIMDFGFAP
jgi:hypothetical protein